METAQYAVLMKEDFDTFFDRLVKHEKVVAPVAKGHGNYAFEEVHAAERVAVKYLPTILPPKKYFMPQQEALLEFRLSRGFEAEPVAEFEKLTLFGVHTCDLIGIQCLNMVFAERPRDYNYLLRKRNITIIGLECNTYCDEHASCCLVSAHLPNGGYDLFFTDLGDCFLVHINTQAGENIVAAARCLQGAEVRHLQALTDLREWKSRTFANEIGMEARHLPDIFDMVFESGVWEDLDKKCLACGNCTMVCPTCYCFDIFDEVALDGKSGRRMRRWDSCQLEPFAKVAGGENFRKERAARQRHRYYRKFRYPVEKFRRFFCTGCGRCSRTCMAGIHLKDTLKALIREKDAKIWKKWL